MLTDLPITEVVDNRGQNRFELRLSGDLVGILGYFDVDGAPGVPSPPGATVMSFMHTVIVEDFGHRGLAAVLVGRALDFARGYGWKVRPVCTYVQRFVAANPNYRDVMVPLEASGR